MSEGKRPLQDTIFDTPLARFDDTPEVVEFLRHKDDLLKFLRDKHAAGPKAKPFDKNEAWNILRRAAYWHFQRTRNKHKTVLSSQRVDRLRELAKILSRASKLADRSLRDEVGFDLYRAWCAETNTQPAIKSDADGTKAFVNPAEQLVEALANLNLLATVANRAAMAVPKKPGPISGSGILPADDILMLAATYERGTGLKPRMGPGPFAEFVGKFLTALGRGDDIAQDYVVEALKYASKRARKNSHETQSPPAKN